MPRTFACAGLILAATLAAGPARADSAHPQPAGPPAGEARSRVVILNADAGDEILREAATRLRAELTAAGFEVVLIERSAAGADLRADLEAAAQDSGAFAAATVSRSGTGAAADLWIVDRVTGKTVIRTVEGSGAYAPSVIAVRAVELLQASLLEATSPRSAAPALAPTPAPPGRRELPADVARWMEAAAAPRPGLLQGFSVEPGLAALQSAGGVGPALGPFLRLSLGAPLGLGSGAGGAHVLAGRLTIAGPTFAPPLEGRAGTISVRQELAALEAVYAPAASAPIVPVFSAGAGAYHLHAVGAPRAPYMSARGDVWAAFLCAGAGLGVRLSDRTAALVALNVLFTEPRAVIHLAGEPLGSAGRPTFAGFFGLIARL